MPLGEIARPDRFRMKSSRLRTQDKDRSIRLGCRSEAAGPQSGGAAGKMEGSAIATAAVLELS